MHAAQGFTTVFLNNMNFLLYTSVSVPTLSASSKLNPKPEFVVLSVVSYIYSTALNSKYVVF